MTKKKIFIGLFVFLILISGVVGGLLLLKQNQEIRERAAPATTIYFQPQNTTASIGQTVNFDVLVDTGGNSLATVRLDINYDQNILQALSLTFNSSLLPQILRPVDLSVPGVISGSAGITPGNPITGSAQKVATVSFKVLQEAPAGSQITFGSNTSAYSATTDEPIGSNLISSKIPATITIAAEVTPTPTQPQATPTPTVTQAPGSTPTPTPSTGSGSPTPTPTTALASATSTPTPKLTNAIIAQATPTPTMPVSGGIIPTASLLFGGIILLFGAALFFLF